MYIRSFFNISSLLIVSLIFLNSCQKDRLSNDNVVEYTTVSKNIVSFTNRNYASPALEQIFSNGNGPSSMAISRNDDWEEEIQIANQIIYDIESESPFMEDLIPTMGSPCWECGLVFYDYNVSIPLFSNNEELTGMLNLLQTGDEIISFNFNLYDFNSKMISYSNSGTLLYNEIVYNVFNNILENDVNQLAGSRNGVCADGYSPTTVNLTPGGGVSLCVCANSNNEIDGDPIDPQHCESDGPGQVDGGHYEAGGLSPLDFLTWEAWMDYYNNFLSNYGGGNSTGGSGSGRPGNNKEDLIRDIQTSTNEQAMMAWLIPFLEDEYGSPLPSLIQQITIADPQIGQTIFLYMNGHFGVTGNANNVHSLLDMLIALSSNSPPLLLTANEIKHLLYVDPFLVNDIQNFLDNHPNRPKAIQVVHDFIGLQHCNSNPCTHLSFSNNLEAIFQLYISLSQEDYAWLHNHENRVVLETGGNATVLELFLEFYLNNISVGQSILIPQMTELLLFSENNNISLSTLMAAGIDDCFGDNNFANCLSINYYLHQGFTNQHFLLSEYEELESLINEIPFVKSGPNLPRAEYVNQIDAIQKYLERRHSEYGESAQYLKDLLPHLIQQDDFTDTEVAVIYEYAYYMYTECAFNTFALSVAEVIKALKPFIEFALIEIAFVYYGASYAIGASASRFLISKLPQAIRASSSLIWNRISNASAYRTNTLIPETFTITANNGNKFYVQYSGTKHMEEMVTLQNNAINYGWFSGQKGLRSQLVLDDFAKALDDIMTNNGNVLMDVPYNAGKWNIKFGAPTANVPSNGHIRIYHAAVN